MGDPDVTGDGAEGSCPDAEQLVALARGKLVDEDRRSVVVHVRGCAECSEVMRLWTRGQGDPSSLGSSSDPKGYGAMVASEGERTLAYPPGPGDVLAGKYRVERVLGIGGMGVVVAATHLQLGRMVALKLMLPTTHGSTETAARFIQEARAASEVQSEHVVRVLDVGALDDGSPFMVMEFLRGNDFARLLRTHGPLPIKDVAGYILQACEAVAEAHALGIVHRDLKPANLFLTTRADGSPLVKVLDFGISKLTRSGGSASLTKSQTTMGTPLYMSPEQLRSTRSVGPGTDIWALGCILYELLAGRPAFFAPSAEALGALIATGPAPKIRDVRPEVPIALEEAIVGCLEKDPGQRLPSLGDLARRIGPFAPADVAALVARVERISGGQPEQLPFADTVNTERPPRFAGTAAGLARSGSATAGRQRANRARWIAGALALGAAAFTVSRVVSTGTAPVAASAAPVTSAPLEAPTMSGAPPTPSALASAALDAAVEAARVTPPVSTASSIAAPVSKKAPGPTKPKPLEPASSPKRPSLPPPNDRDSIE